MPQLAKAFPVGNAKRLRLLEVDGEFFPAAATGHNGAASLTTAASTVSSDGNVVVAGDSVLSTASSVASTGTVAVVGDSALSTACSTTAAGAVAVVGDTTISTSSSTASAGAIAIIGSAALSTDTSAGAEGAVLITGEAVLSTSAAVYSVVANSETPSETPTHLWYCRNRVSKSRPRRW